MAALKDARRERFAQEIVKGRSTAEAFEIAGFKPNPGNARRLRVDEAVSKRIEALLDRREAIDEAATKKTIDRLAITKERVLGELAKIGFANISDYVDLTGETPSWALKDVPDDKMAAVAELTTETVFERTKAGGAPSEVRKVKLKFWNKPDALGKLGQHLGLFRDRVEISGPDGQPIETKDVSARVRIASRIAGITSRSGTGGDPS